MAVGKPARRAVVVASLVLVAAAIFAGVAVRRVATNDPPATARPAPKLVPVEQIRWSTGYIEPDHRHLVVSFTGGGPAEAPIGPCNPAYRAEVADDGAGVTVTVRALLPPSVPKDVICAAIGYDRHLRVALPQPWRGERVTDGSSGAPRPVFDTATLRQPTWLPAGYQLTSQDVCTARTTCFERRYGQALSLQQGARTQVHVPDGDQVLERLLVHGVTATAHKTPGFDDVVCLTWTEGSTGQQVCAHGSPRPPLGLDVLARVANGLR